MGTTTAPRKRIPQKHATHSAELAPHRRTRSPGAIPVLPSVELQDRECAESSAYVSFSRRYPRVCTTATSPAKRAKSLKSVIRFRRGINALLSVLCPGDDFTSEPLPAPRREIPYPVSAVEGILEISAFPMPGRHGMHKGPKRSARIPRVLRYNSFTVSVQAETLGVYP